MTCEELHELGYLPRDLTLTELAACLRHVQKCPGCMKIVGDAAAQFDLAHPELGAELDTKGVEMYEKLRSSEDPEL